MKKKYPWLPRTLSACNAEKVKTALDKAIAAGWIDYRSMKLDPRFDPIRNSSAFQETLTRLKQKIQTMRRRVEELKGCNVSSLQH
jgi:hypothetical protein